MRQVLSAIDGLENPKAKQLGAMILATSQRLDQLWDKATPQMVLGWLSKTQVRGVLVLYVQAGSAWSLGSGHQRAKLIWRSQAMRQGCWLLTFNFQPVCGVRPGLRGVYCARATCSCAAAEPTARTRSGQGSTNCAVLIASFDCVVLQGLSAMDKIELFKAVVFHVHCAEDGESGGSSTCAGLLPGFASLRCTLDHDPGWCPDNILCTLALTASCFCGDWRASACVQLPIPLLETMRPSTRPMHAGRTGLDAAAKYVEMGLPPDCANFVYMCMEGQVRALRWWCTGHMPGLCTVHAGRLI